MTEKQKRPGKDQWLEARVKWESDPSETFESIGKMLGISRVSVFQRCKRDGWERTQSLAQITEKAHLKADKANAKPNAVVSAAGQANAVDERVSVLVKQRSDWTTHRETFGLAHDGIEEARHAKVVAEMLAIRHKSEREAYGITATDTTDDTKPKGYRLVFGDGPGKGGA